MKAPMLVLAALAAATALAATAADAPKKQLTPQQQRMSDCAHESKGMKGDAHKKFMSECLKSKDSPADVKAAMGKPAAPATSAKQTQQEKMKTCNAEAGQKKLKGDDRKKFMSDCLKG
jgi:hypothetical protein